MPALLVLLALFIPLMVSAEAAAPAPVAIIEVRWLLDKTLVDFMKEAITEEAMAGTQVVVLELDSPGATTAEVYELLEFLTDPPLPVVVWVGPEPAEAYGAAGQMVAAAPIGAAAPGALVGYLSPTVAGAEDRTAVLGPQDLQQEAIAVHETRPGFIDVVEPALPQLVAGLDGLEVSVRGEPVALQTLVEAEGQEGESIIHPVEAHFVEPGLGVRVVRTALSPDAAFFLLVLGLAVAAFEFYALGPGVAAGAAALSLLLAAYGMVNMPMHWWGLAATTAGLLILAVQFQRSRRAGLPTLVGALALFVGGIGLTDASPQFGPTWWVALLSTATAVFFFVIALPAVSKARLSTPTIGRSHLVGRRGRASNDFTDGAGIAEVEGSRWRAASHREANLHEGDALLVTGVDGIHLLVDRENKSGG